MTARRSWWGWGNLGEGLSDTEIDGLGRWLSQQFPNHPDGRRDPPPPSELNLAPPRIEAPGTLVGIVSGDTEDRARHSHGNSYRDVVRALHGLIEHPTDLVARPSSEAEVVAVLDWCTAIGAAAIPYGGGTSVVGGVEPDVGDAFNGVVTVDLERLNGVLEVDEQSLAARIQSGTLGPSLEDQLRPSGLTLRHFPQSFEFSTLGGWIATRAGGHFATGPTHIDDLVESMRVVTPAGLLETRRLPGSGAGPSPDRLFLGSEGVLGIITEAWVRIRPRLKWRAGGPVRFDTFVAGAAAVRELAQSGLEPSNCRLIDPLEAVVSGAGDGSSSILIVGFESADHPLDTWAQRAKAIVEKHGGVPDASWGALAESDRADGRGAGNVAGAWRKSFLRAPYLRDALVRLGMLTETFETAITWERLDQLLGNVTAAAEQAIQQVGMKGGFVTCRFTHAYSDGPAPYFTVIGPATRGAELEQWAEIKRAASEAVLSSGGTITHHHAVGRDHRPWYDRQRPELFAEALRAAKAVLDPGGICNPGVLIDPVR